MTLSKKLLLDFCLFKILHLSFNGMTLQVQTYAIGIEEFFLDFLICVETQNRNVWVFAVTFVQSNNATMMET